jgi:hypothetical protein
MKINLRSVGVGLLAFLVASAQAETEAVLDERTGGAARRIIARSDQVIIAGFRVVFHLDADAGADGKVSLTGITPAEFQQIADEAHADLRARLLQAGLTVRDAGEIPGTGEQNEPALALLASGKGFSTSGRAAVFSAAGFPPPKAGLERPGPGPTSLPGWRALNELSVETKAVVIFPTLVVKFIATPAEADARVALAPLATRIAVAHARIRLSGDLGYFQLAGEVAASGPFGTFRTSRHDGEPQRRFEANPADYRRLALEVIRRFNRATGDFIAAR